MSLFIVLEGIDGAGKTTQAFLLEKWLKKKGKKVFVTREPTDGLIGGIIRAAITKKLKISQKTLQLLFAADRSEHVKEIVSNLKKGKIVICDRYFFSSIAYGMLELDKKWLMNLNSTFPKPSLIILLDVPAIIALRRLGVRFSKTYFEKVDVLSKVRQHFLALRNNFKNYYVVDASKPIEEVHKKIIRIVSKYI